MRLSLPFASVETSLSFLSFITSMNTRSLAAPKCGLRPSPASLTGAPPAAGIRNTPGLPDQLEDVIDLPSPAS